MGRQQQLREAKQAIRAFIKLHWSYQKLVEVIAFNADGRMRFDTFCLCIKGVTLADTLHRLPCRLSGYDIRHHYTQAAFLSGADSAELGYGALAYGHGDDIRQRIFDRILRAELRRRGREQSQAAEVAPAEAEVVNV